MRAFHAHDRKQRKAENTVIPNPVTQAGAAPPPAHFLPDLRSVPTRKAREPSAPSAGPCSQRVLRGDSGVSGPQEAGVGHLLPQQGFWPRLRTRALSDCSPGLPGAPRSSCRNAHGRRFRKRRRRPCALLRPSGALWAASPAARAWTVFPILLIAREDLLFTTCCQSNTEERQDKGHPSGDGD